MAVPAPAGGATGTAGTAAGMGRAAPTAAAALSPLSSDRSATHHEDLPRAARSLHSRADAPALGWAGPGEQRLRAHHRWHAILRRGWCCTGLQGGLWASHPGELHPTEPAGEGGNQGSPKSALVGAVGGLSLGTEGSKKCHGRSTGVLQRSSCSPTVSTELLNQGCLWPGTRYKQHKLGW